jgi:hypothetical protein
VKKDDPDEDHPAEEESARGEDLLDGQDLLDVLDESGRLRSVGRHG